MFSLRNATRPAKESGLFGLHEKEGQDAQYLLSFLAGELQCKKEDILDFDLYVYNAEEGVRVGVNQEFFSSPRLDNQTSCRRRCSAG